MERPRWSVLRARALPLAGGAALLAVVLLAVAAAGCAPPRLVAYRPHPGPNPPPRPEIGPPPPVDDHLPPPPTGAEFRNVDFRFDEDLVLEVRSLRGEMRGKEDGPVTFDDPSSFVMVLSDAETAMTAESMTALMQRYVFGYEGAPIEGLEVRPEDGVLHQSGVLHKGIDIPFEMRASVAATPEGRVRIHPVDMRICNLPGLGLMDALGIELEDLLDLDGAPPGIAVEGNDLLLAPLMVLPEPDTRGHLESVRVEGARLVLSFGPPREGPPARKGPPPAMPLPDAPNYMFFWDGVLRFGKLYMPEADMQVVDESPADPFDFFLELYNRQLVAGFTRNRADYGLEVHMVDYGKLPPEEGGRGDAARPG